MLRKVTGLFAAAVVLWASAAAYGITPADKCEADKLKRAGQYSFCRLKAEAKAVKTGGSPDYSLCDVKLSGKWASAETSGAGQCPTDGDLATIQARLASDADDVRDCLNGACPAGCGDGTANAVESCDGSDLAGASCVTLGFAGGTLGCTAGCGFDVTGCTTATNSCGDEVINGSDSCDGADLGGATCASLGYTLGGTLGCTAGCGYDVSGCQSQAFPATGQTTAYYGDFGPGSDGVVQAGATVTYTDNGDGTVTDNNTGLMWEKKSDDGSIHDKDNGYTWGSTSPPYAMNGTIVTTFLNTLNDVAGGGANCFAGYCDWRIPNRAELLSINSVGKIYPAVSDEFNTGCSASCTVLTCSCTFIGGYWSSSTYIIIYPDSAWYVFFYDGTVNRAAKSTGLAVRAVRGGL